RKPNPNHRITRRPHSGPLRWGTRSPAGTICQGLSRPGARGSWAIPALGTAIATVASRVQTLPKRGAAADVWAIVTREASNRSAVAVRKNLRSIVYTRRRHSMFRCEPFLRKTTPMVWVPLLASLLACGAGGGGLGGGGGGGALKPWAISDAANPATAADVH